MCVLLMQVLFCYFDFPLGLVRAMRVETKRLTPKSTVRKGGFRRREEVKCEKVGGV